VARQLHTASVVYPTTDAMPFLQAGYKLIDQNNPGIAVALNEDIRLGNAYAETCTNARWRQRKLGRRNSASFP
jgi:hypothetical protein